MAKVTLKEIAREAGLSVSTVSLVLNNRPCRVSDENRRRIKAIAAAKRYVPNQIARSLVMQRSGTLGLIVPNIESRFFSSLAKNLEQRCRARGYALFITTSDDLASQDIELISTLVTRGVEGLFIVMGNQREGGEELPERIAECPVPYVMIDRVLDELACDRVLFDNELGGYLATRHLLEHGHRRIACIVNASRPRRAGGASTGTAAHSTSLAWRLTRGSSLTRTTTFPRRTRRRPRARDGRDRGVRKLGHIALGLLKRLYECGRRVPRDYSVVSYDNSAARLAL